MAGADGDKAKEEAEAAVDEDVEEEEDDEDDASADRRSCTLRTIEGGVCRIIASAWKRHCSMSTSFLWFCEWLPTTKKQGGEQRKKKQKAKTTYGRLGKQHDRLVKGRGEEGRAQLSQDRDANVERQSRRTHEDPVKQVQELVHREHVYAPRVI